MNFDKATASLFAVTLALAACTDDGDTDTSGGSETAMPGDGDPGDGDPGDGDPGDGDPGDGDPGDGDPGDGDPGDGDPGAGCGADPGWVPVAVGQPVKHVAAKNHLGEAVNLCDWAGVPIALDAAAVWCNPCRAASEYLATGATQDPFSGLGPSLRDMIETDKMVWLTALTENATNGPGAVSDAAAWDMLYHHDKIPVIAEDDVPMLSGYLMNTCVPAVFVVGPDLNWFALDDCMSWNHLGELVNTFGG